MIKPFVNLMRATIAACLVLVALPLHAQEDFGKVQQEGINAMKAGDWAGAQKIFQGFVDDFQNTAVKVYGPKFGWFYYNKGITELKLKAYDDAVNSFQTCFEKFPNDLEGGNKSVNIYHTRALNKWGEAEEARGNYAKAIEFFEKFNKDRKAADKFNKGNFYTNLGTSYFKLEKPNFEKGLLNLESVMVNRVNWNVTSGSVMKGLHSLAEASIKAGEEQVILDFVTKNRSKIKSSDREMVGFGPLITSLAGQAAQANMNQAALALLSIAPSSRKAIAEIKEVLAGVGLAKTLTDKEQRRIIRKASFEKLLADLEKKQALGRSFDSNILSLTGVIHLRMGNSLASYYAFKLLHEQYPKAKGAEGNLFRLINVASSISRIDEAQAFAQEYEKKYAKGPNIDKVRGITLNSLLTKGEYGKVVKIGEGLLAKLEEKSKEHDAALAAVGTALFYKQDFAKAVEAIGKYLKMYPKSDPSKALSYFQASALRRLGKSAEAAVKLQAFIDANPDPKTNTFYVQAHNELAGIYFKQAKYDEALVLIGKLEKLDENNPDLAGALNIKGDILQIKKDYPGAKASYERAVQLAEKGGNSIYAGEALGALIALYDGGKLELPEAESDKKIVALYDQFFEKHRKGSPYGARIGTTAFPAMLRAGRTEDALARMREIIVDLSKQQRQLGMEAAIEVYTDAYLKAKSPEELKTHFYNFPEIQEKDHATRALLRIAVVGVYEREGKKAKKENNKDQMIKSDAAIKVIFRELKDDFDPKILSNVILVKLGDYIRENSAAKAEALVYYETALSRNDKTKKYEAHFGLGDILIDTKQTKKGIDNLLTAFKEASVKDQAPLKEAALYRVITYYLGKENWEKVGEYGKIYRESTKPRFVKHSGEVLFAYATSFHKRGMKDQAIAEYTVLFGPFAGRIDLAAPSYSGYLELLWEKNAPGKVGEGLDLNHPKHFGSRQAATYAIELWIEATEKQLDKVTPAQRKMHEDLRTKVKEYIGKDPNVRSLAEIRKARGQ